MSLAGRRAVVTGAGRGIGRAIAVRLATNGAAVLASDVDARAADSVAEEIRGLGFRAVAAAADVSEWEAVVTMVEAARSELGGLEILVNSAGIIRRGSLGSMSLDDWHRVIAVNLTGTFYCCKAAAPLLLEAGWGRIINITSIAGKMGDITSAPGYGPSKAGVIALTQSLARELAPSGITVNAVAPHAVLTEMSAEWPPEKRAAIVAGIPLGRLATADEVAAAVAFLASDEAGFITGETLDVNGGAWMD